MSVYRVIEITEIGDPATYAEYQKLIPSTIEKYGGRYIVRCGPIAPLTGKLEPGTSDHLGISDGGANAHLELIAGISRAGSLTRAR